MLVHQHMMRFLHIGWVTRLVVKSFGVVLAFLFLSVAFVGIGPGAQASASAACTRSYTIVWGDTLGTLAARYGTSVETLASINGIPNPDLIFAGQSLCLAGTQDQVPVYTVPVQPQSKPVQQQQPGPAPAVPQYSAPSSGGSVAQMIRQVFGAYGNAAVSVATCESGLNPGASNPSGASGVFQIMPGTWTSTSQAGSSPYNAWANITAAHEIFVRDGFSWRQWSCQP